MNNIAEWQAACDMVLTPLISVRVVLFRPSEPNRVVVRQSVNGRRVVLVGGKLNYYPTESIVDGARREVLEESSYRIGDLHCLAVLPAPRFVELDEDESSHLNGRRFAATAWGLVTCEILFAAAADQAVPHRLIEGRRLVEVDLNSKNDIPFKKRHHRAVSLYRSWAQCGSVRLNRDERRLTDGFRKIVLGK